MAIKGLAYHCIGEVTASVAGQCKSFYPCLASATIGKETETTDIECFTNSGNCIKQKVATVITSETYTVELEFSVIDWMTLQLMQGEASAISATYEFPNSGSGVVTNGILEAPGVTSAMDGTQLCVTVTSCSATQSEQHMAVAGAPSATEVQAGTDQIIFDAAFEGASVHYKFTETLSNVETIGVEDGAIALTELSFAGVMCPILCSGIKGFGVIVRRMTLDGSWELAINDDLGTVTLSYTAALQTGRKTPVEFVRIP